MTPRSEKLKRIRLAVDSLADGLDAVIYDSSEKLVSTQHFRSCRDHLDSAQRSLVSAMVFHEAALKAEQNK